MRSNDKTLPRYLRGNSVKFGTQIAIHKLIMEQATLEIHSVRVLLSETDSFLVEFGNGCNKNAAFTLKRYIYVSETDKSSFVSVQVKGADIQGSVKDVFRSDMMNGNRFAFENVRNVKRIVFKFKNGGIVIAYKNPARYRKNAPVFCSDFHLSRNVESIEIY